MEIQTLYAGWASGGDPNADQCGIQATRLVFLTYQFPAWRISSRLFYFHQFFRDALLPFQPIRALRFIIKRCLLAEICFCRPCRAFEPRISNMDFKLVSSYKPQGDQGHAISSLLRGLQDREQHQVLLGVTGSGKTYTMAKVIEQVNRPALVMAHNKTLAAQLYHEFKSFSPHN